MKRLATAALAAATALTISTVPALAADDKEGSSLADTTNSKSGESSLSSDDKSGEKGSSSLTDDKSGDIKLSSDDKSGEKGSSSLTDDKSGDIKLSSDNESDKDSNRNLLIGLGILAALIGAFNFAMQSGVLPFKI